METIMRTSSEVATEKQKTVYRSIFPNGKYTGIEASSYRAALIALMNTSLGEVAAESLKVPEWELRNQDPDDIDVVVLEGIEKIINRLGYRIIQEKKGAEYDAGNYAD